MAIASDEMLRLEHFEIEQFVTLGLGRYEAIRAVEAGIDWRTVERLVAVGHSLALALATAR